MKKVAITNFDQFNSIFNRTITSIVKNVIRPDLPEHLWGSNDERDAAETILTADWTGERYGCIPNYEYNRFTDTNDWMGKHPLEVTQDNPYGWITVEDEACLAVNAD